MAFKMKSPMFFSSAMKHKASIDMTEPKYHGTNVDGHRHKETGVGGEYGSEKVPQKSPTPAKMKSPYAKKKCGPYKKKNAQGKEQGADGKACWDGYRYAGTENGKDKCVPIGKK